jgi:hypothetical protein
MDSDRRENKRMPICHADCAFEIGRPIPGADGEHVFQPCFARTLNHLVPVSIELLIV